MDRNEFLAHLRSALSQGVSEAEVREQLAYYDQYISGEMSKGRSEEDVLSELGDPALIAKTIIDVEEMKSEGMHTGYAGSDRGTWQGQADERDLYERRKGSVQMFGPKVLWLIVGVVVVVGLVLALLLKVAAGILGLLAPIAVPIIIVLLVLSLFRRR